MNLLRFEFRKLIDVFSCHNDVAHRYIYFLIDFYRRHDHFHTLTNPFIFKHIPEFSGQIEIGISINKVKLIDSLLLIYEIVGSIDSLL